MTIRCDMCHKPLKEKRYSIVTPLRPELTLIVGPDCYRKTKKAEKELRARNTPEQIEALRVKVAAKFKNVSCSQCGQDFGPGPHGFSYCDRHSGLIATG
jgi:hypothetical protein